MGFFKSNLYKWHSSLSIIIAIPVLLWAASGFMHPLMTNIRPKIATQGLAPVPVDGSKIHVPLQAALRLHHLDSISNFRLIHIDTNWFYQVQPAEHHPATGRTSTAAVAGQSVSPDRPPGSDRQTSSGNIPVYLSCLNGNVLPAGDWLYAQYLAREFLEGPADPHPHKTATNARLASGPPDSLTAPSAHDCCGAATDCVLNPVKGSKVANVSLVKDYDLEYKSINKILPVYRVSFDRPDGIRIYVETTRDRFAFAMDKRRFVFDRIFTMIHTWAWLDFLGKGRLAIVFTLVFLAFLTTLMGISIFFITKSKKVSGNELVAARRTHRYVSVTIALFTLMFTFSGAFHALSQFREDTRDRFFVTPSFAAADLDFNFSQLQDQAKIPISDISIVSMYGHSYWQLSTVSAPLSKDLMKDAESPFSAIYISADSLHEVLPQGEIKYAGFLASTFSGRKPEDIQNTDPVLRFTSEYNFADKRLPVWRVSYASGHNERYYVETSTGRLSKRVTDLSLTEEYSFAFLHKHEFMGWGGKGLKDASTMFWALAQILMVVIGLTLYFKVRARKRIKRS